jgi:hypothetical protein
VSDTYDLFCALIDEHGYTPLDAADSLHLDFATKERYRKRRNKQAQRASLNPDYLRRLTVEHRPALDLLATDDGPSAIRIPQNGGPPPLQPLVLPDANAMLLGDLHTPYHNRQLIERGLTVKRRDFPHIPRLIIIGDLYDFASISRHPKDQQEASVDEEIEIAGALLYEFSRHFEEVYICAGNHDRRLMRQVGALGLQRLIDMSVAAARRTHGDFPEPTVTELDYLTLQATTPERSWRVGHPGNYSGDGGKTPALIASRQRINVATGHNHHVGMQISDCGGYLGWDIGHCLDAARINYKVQNLTKYKAWSAGFGFIENGYAFAYTERFTPWAVLGL